MRLTDFLLQLGRVVAYYPALTTITGGVNPTLLLCQLRYWTEITKDPDRWIYKTRDDIRQETGMSRWEQETARRELRTRGLLQEKFGGIPRKRFYRLNLEAINKAWENNGSREVAEILHKDGFSPTIKMESHQQDGGFPTNKMEVFPPAITKITPEITPQESTQECESDDSPPPPYERIDPLLRDAILAMRATEFHCLMPSTKQHEDFWDTQIEKMQEAGADLLVLLKDVDEYALTLKLSERPRSHSGAMRCMRAWLGGALTRWRRTHA